ncbi:MAG: endolytic transglycosylase MltG [Porphyromonadaceae bacterium]|nr:endolytic transglycosylase MltG [uncultured Macellibacteroides sp.]MCE5225403.1 endolytic transglycosylase MltG [Porphyromonadaceae bacterium]
MSKFFRTKRAKRTFIRRVMALFVVLLLAAGFWAYRMVLASNFSIKETTYVYVDSQKNFNDLCNQLKDSASCKSLASFKQLAYLIGYPDKMKTGRYAIEPGTGNLRLLKNLIGGLQSPIRITFNNIRLRTDLAQRLDDQLMVTKDELLTRFADSAYCAELGFTTETIQCMFIPNTYELYWDITPDNFMKRMQKEYKAFWTADRLAKAAKIGITPVQVSVLASIVEEETAKADEMGMVAGLYLNRLQINMPLQADPTVKYAVGDVTLKRIMFEHLQVESPYNTYKHTGLPPGPIRVPSIKGINAVLNHDQHNYIYMCAKEDFSGRHNFASTLAEHAKNANRYRAELNRRQIK